MAAFFMRKREKTMNKIEELRRQRAGINTQVQALAQIEMNGGTLSAEQLEQFTGLQAQFDELGVHSASGSGRTPSRHHGDSGEGCAERS
jgi:hypothetical protein